MAHGLKVHINQEKSKYLNFFQVQYLQEYSNYFSFRTVFTLGQWSKADNFLNQDFFLCQVSEIKIPDATSLEYQDRLKLVLPDDSAGGLVVSKALSLNLNFRFVNWISLLHILISYPIALTRLGGPR